MTYDQSLQAKPKTPEEAAEKTFWRWAGRAGMGAGLPETWAKVVAAIREQDTQVVCPECHGFDDYCADVALCETCKGSGKVAVPELPEAPCCPVHESLFRLGQVKPLDNCFVCIRNERDEQKATIAGLAAQLADERHARHALEVANEELRTRLANIESERDELARYSGEVKEAVGAAAQGSEWIPTAIKRIIRERDEALEVRDRAREASNRDLMAKRAAERTAILAAFVGKLPFPDDWRSAVIEIIMAAHARLPNLEVTVAADGTHAAEKESTGG